ncbi:DUF4180 domain-containing protein [Streptomyces anulatus]|uniref:DUF4180 domain-containing protein n=1 Tax=Streptomyces TaxID=1883 RepID=UPI000700AB41|nr:MULTISPECIES: DUF4180 domain-containing protein [Streptomyces]KQX30398.1 alpha/beta hydrolase [Streptomyces sp. Root1295]KRA40327.1 alpha/beta hydrolase [Streptomyces sp. Root63]MDF9808831.1 hypothetical protein [Streptomyces sp. HB372]WSR80563.1 DUF4180 domain-containing protein [Streptomyces anulatus]
MPEVVEHHGVPVLVCEADGVAIADVQDALDHLIGAAFACAEVVAVPSARLDDRFFDLSTGLAGAILQKFANYRLRLVVLGDISHHLSASSALPDLVREANRGRDIWFVPDLDALAERLAPNVVGRSSG